MTFEQRLAELGVDLSDLKPVAERRYDREGHPVTVQAALMDYYADIIDRMETRIVNLTGERDYLVEQISKVIGDCDICVYSDCNGAEMPCYQCNFPDRNFEFASVPEDWRPDDGCSD